MGIKILRTGLPVIGYAKIGIASEKSSPLKGAPMRWDHIELTGVERDPAGRLIPDLPLMRELITRGAKTCGGCARAKELGFPDGLPVQLGIFLPYNDLELNFPSRLSYFRGRTAFCTGDGETAKRRKVLRTEKVQGKDLETLGAEEPYPGCGWGCKDLIDRRCKPYAKLRFVLAIQENVGGCFEFKTTSLNSISNITEGLSMTQAATGGVLQWIPLLFEISPQTVQPRDGGRASTAYIARVTFPGSPQKLVEAVHAHLQVRAPMVAEIRKLEASIKKGAWSETPVEIEHIVSEFYQPDAGDDLNQETVDPVTGEVFGEKVIDRTEQAELETAPASSPAEPAAAAEPEIDPETGQVIPDWVGRAPAGPFDATAEEQAAESARQATAGAADAITTLERDHVVELLDGRGMGTTARLNWIRRLVRRNVTTTLDLTQGEYERVCAELRAQPRSAAAPDLPLEASA